MAHVMIPARPGRVFEVEYASNGIFVTAYDKEPDTYDASGYRNVEKMVFRNTTEGAKEAMAFFEQDVLGRAGDFQKQRTKKLLDTEGYIEQKDT